MDLHCFQEHLSVLHCFQKMVIVSPYSKVNYLYLGKYKKNFFEKSDGETCKYLKMNTCPAYKMLALLENC